MPSTHLLTRRLLLAALTGTLAFAQDAATARVPDVPYVPTPQPIVDEMLKLANMKQGDVMYDLGCGDGRIVITAAQKYGAKATGIDINPERISEATENAKKAGLTGKVRFLNQDLFQADFRDANVVTLYLLPNVNLRLRPKLLSELKPGSRIVSHSFNMGDWQPDRRIEIEGRVLYMWTVPPKGTPVGRNTGTSVRIPIE